MGSGEAKGGKEEEEEEEEKEQRERETVLPLIVGRLFPPSSVSSSENIRIPFPSQSSFSSAPASRIDPVGSGNARREKER